MDKWFKDILPDKDPYHNRGRHQMRKKGGPEDLSACGNSNAYITFQIFDRNHISSCTYVGSVLQLCKVSFKSNELFRRSCAYKVHAPPFREIISWIISPFKFWTATIFLHAHLQTLIDGYLRLSSLLADENNTSINSFYIHYSEQIHA